MVKIDPNKLQRLIVHNAKILDINHGGVCTMTCDLSGTFPPNTRAILLSLKRQSGTGGLELFVDGGATSYRLEDLESLLLPITNDELKYTNEVAGDDHDLYVIAYIIEGTLKTK